MKSNYSSIEHYLRELPDERKPAINQLINIFSQNSPTGFEAVMNYAMIGYVVPHTIYPKGYHCDPKVPLPYINIASQKNFIALYHMGIYGNSKILDWFVSEYPKHTKFKLDMGKGCVRFKKLNDIPFLLIEELVKKISLEKYIAQYEANINRK